MRATSGSEGFGRIRSTLLKQEPTQLVRLIGELYQLSKDNRRFVETRLGEAAKQFPVYQQFVVDCLRPDPLRKGAKVRIAEAKRAISQYERASGDVAGTAELMLTFVEQGTEFAAELGYGDEDFFSSLEGMLSRALNGLQSCTEQLRQNMRPRLIRLSEQAQDIGWGYGDFVNDVIAHAVEPDIRTVGISALEQPENLEELVISATAPGKPPKPPGRRSKNWAQSRARS